MSNDRKTTNRPVREIEGRIDSPLLIIPDDELCTFLTANLILSQQGSRKLTSFQLLTLSQTFHNCGQYSMSEFCPVRSACSFSDEVRPTPEPCYLPNRLAHLTQCSDDTPTRSKIDCGPEGIVPDFPSRRIATSQNDSARQPYP